MVDVYTHRKKAVLAAQRSAERREREERAPRLKTAVPTLSTLRIVVEDRYPLGATKHTRHVIVERAAALFGVPCGDATCASEGHDITSDVMRALYARATQADSEHSCDGNVGSAGCARVIHFRVEAKYVAG
jgi:hypothetical protein